MKLKKILLNPFIIAFLFGILGLHLVRELGRRKLSAPPALVEVGPWQLIDQDKSLFGSKELNNKVVVAYFFFTRCPTVCPKLTQSVLEARKRLSNLLDRVEFIGITVDPEHDTAEVLSEYKKANSLEWPLLTGTRAQITEVVEGKMKLPIGATHHLAEIVLFDRKGDLRAKFSTNPEGLSALQKATEFLVDNPGK